MIESMWPLPDYNTRVVVLGSTLLGLAAGVIGSFTLMRKRALVGDALSHATLPGICVAFLIAESLGWDGKVLGVLLLGAAVSGTLGVGAISVICRHTMLREDAALGIVLSVTFGAGLALLGLVQQTDTGNAAGLESFIYGKTAALLASDAALIAVAALACIAVSVALFKELTLLCFDSAFARSRGFPVRALDAVLMAMVVVITIIGLQAVGLVLMIALLVIPAAAARFWTEDLRWVTGIAAGVGAGSCFLGALASALSADLPSGPTIVLVAAAIFGASALFGARRGVVVRWSRRHRLERRIALEHLLRGIYEITETRNHAVAPLTEVLALRSWSRAAMQRLVARAERLELVRRDTLDAVRLTGRGVIQAEWLTRQHRLWELYLITHAEIAPGKVDRGADAIEHVLDPETIDELERLLDAADRPSPPASPHAIRPGAPA